MENLFQNGLCACGWWTLDLSKIRNSNADYWIFTLHRFNHKNLQFIVIKPGSLIKLFESLNRTGNRIQSYIWITEKSKAWETRGLKKQDQILIANNAFSDPNRNLTKYLNNWTAIKKYLN